LHFGKKKHQNQKTKTHYINNYNHLILFEMSIKLISIAIYVQHDLHQANAHGFYLAFQEIVTWPFGISIV
jgi:hypothetical protein